MKIKRIHHMTVAVRDAEAARATFEELLGARPLGIAAMPAFGVQSAGVALGDDVLRLVSPTSADNPLMRFLERKGEGFYNVALEVDDLDAAVRELTGRGIHISPPIEAEPGLRSAFITMAATHGLSVQLVEVIAAGRATGDARSAGGSPAVADERVPSASSAEPRGPLDLTPDEWSDAD